MVEPYLLWHCYGLSHASHTASAAYMYVLLNVGPGVLYVIYGMRGVIKLSIQHKAKPSAVLATRPRDKYNF